MYFDIKFNFISNLNYKFKTYYLLQLINNVRLKLLKYKMSKLSNNIHNNSNYKKEKNINI